MNHTKAIYVISDIDKAIAFEWIADNLNKNIFQLSFILIIKKPSTLEAYLKDTHINCTAFYYKTKKDIPGLLWQVYKVFKMERPDVVHCHLLYGTLIGLTAARLAGIRKRIYTRHHSDYHHRYFPRGIILDKWCNKMATTIVAPSSAVKHVLETMENVSSQKIATIHHGFDMDYFTYVTADRISALKDKYHTLEYYPVVGVISRFTELKGIQYIIPAFKSLLELYPNALLLLFNANGDYENHIKNQLKTIPQENYRLITFEEDLSAVYKLFDLFLQVSIDRTIEAFGQTYVEALAAGVPSIFTLSGIAPDFVLNGENALVVPFKNSNAIYNSMLSILAQPALQEKLKQKGFQSVKEKFRLQLMINQLEELYGQ